MPAAVAIPSLISAGTSVAGGLIGRSAAKNAAEAQRQAALAAAEQVRAAAAAANPQIGEAARSAGTAVEDAARASAEAINRAAQEAAGGVSGAAGQANQYLAPYLGAGEESVATLRSLLAPGGNLNRTFTAADMEAYDPGYAFRLAEAQKALERSAAARGTLLGGGTLKALTRYSQDYASQEFANAYDRFLRGQQQRFGQLSSLAGMGFDAARASGNNLMNAAQYGGNMGFEGERLGAGLRTGAAEFSGRAGMDAASQQAANTLRAALYGADATQGAGNAAAAGHIGAANAWSGMLSGLAGAGQGYYTLRELNRPSQISVPAWPYLPTQRNPNVTLSDLLRRQP